MRAPKRLAREPGACSSLKLSSHHLCVSAACLLVARRSPLAACRLSRRCTRRSNVCVDDTQLARRKPSMDYYMCILSCVCTMLLLLSLVEEIRAAHAHSSTSRALLILACLGATIKEWTRCCFRFRQLTRRRACAQRLFVHASAHATTASLVV